MDVQGSGVFDSARRSRWVPPSDRQLALRAKLQAGWSVKSGQNRLGKVQPLSEEEQQAILKVVQRAETLEKAEQQRIGRLVDRLHRLRRNASGDGQGQCGLCAESFGIITGPTGTPCHDCHKSVCSKCGIESGSGKGEGGMVWLCKLCAEARELWKKSGAWFFKTLPAYTLPQSGEVKGRPSPLPLQGSARRQAPPAWARNKELATEDTEEESSEEDLLGIRTHSIDGTVRYQQVRSRKYSSSGDSSAPDAPDASNTGGGGDSLRPKSPISIPIPTSPRTPRPPPSPTFPVAPPYPSSPVFSRPPSSPRLPGSTAFSRPPSSPWPTRSQQTPSIRSDDSLRIPGLILPQQQQPPPSPVPSRKNPTPISTPRMKPRHIRSASISEGSQSESDDYYPFQTVSTRRSSVSSMGESSEHPSILPSHQASGELEFSLTYYEDQQALHCTVIRAKDLQATEHTGYADPYVLVHLLPRAARGGEMRTRTVHRTLHPEFNETVTYHGIRPEDLVVKSLQLSVVDEDRFGHDNLGEVIQPLNVLQPQVPFHTIAKLDLPHWKMARKGSMDPVGMDPSVERGKILLSLKFSSSRHALIVGIIRCKGLFPKDINGYSDPFVRVSLLPDPQHRRYKTTTKHKNLNPTFNEEFIFDGKLSDLPKRTLDISVWDKDYGRRDDFLGSLRIGIESKGERLRHWFETIKNPDIRHDRWHALTGDFIPDT